MFGNPIENRAFGHQAYSGTIEVGRPPLVNYDVEPLKSSESALILKESPSAIVVFGTVPKATASEPAISAPVRHIPDIFVRCAEVNVNVNFDVAIGGC